MTRSQLRPLQGGEAGLDLRVPVAAQLFQLRVDIRVGLPAVEERQLPAALLHAIHKVATEELGAAEDQSTHVCLPKIPLRKKVEGRFQPSTVTLLLTCRRR